MHNQHTTICINEIEVNEILKKKKERFCKKKNCTGSENNNVDKKNKNCEKSIETLLVNEKFVKSSYRCFCHITKFCQCTNCPHDHHFS